MRRGSGASLDSQARNLRKLEGDLQQLLTQVSLQISAVGRCLTFMRREQLALVQLAVRHDRSAIRPSQAGTCFSLT